MIFNFGNQNSNLDVFANLEYYTTNAYSSTARPSLTLPKGKYILCAGGAGQSVYAGTIGFSGATVENVKTNIQVHESMTTATVELSAETTITMTLTGNNCSSYCFTAIKVG